ncbi:MAG: sulfur carrier protein ThiS [Deltaproteobacteria bacterium]|nr:sulfur carrier protein ThiS [Deltaproteobacteria bacterium]MBW2254055.1 sulfur carrier protein ThiS [Deltaproteobacteria bacterium]
MTRIRLNGEDHEIAPGTTIADLLRAMDMPSEGVAVAVERKVVPHSAHAEHVLEEGVEVEVIRAVGGG